MIQKTIREWNSVPYTTTEGSELIKELDDRTSHSVDGYNSTAEIGAKVLVNETTGATNITNIANNVINISTNTSGVAANLANITTNTADILLRESLTNKGIATGYAELDATGKVPAAQIPAGADSVVEYANLAAFPATGAANIIYIALDTNLTYRWGGTVYVVLDPSLALGETSTTAYRGDNGLTAYTHSQATHAPSDATDDQTGAEIKTAYELEADTNAYDDAAVTKLGTIETSATADQTGAEIKVLYELESDTNPYTDAEVVKLAGIETSATADQSDTEIKTAYENNANTEAFTTANQTKVGVAVISDTSAEPTGSDQVLNIVSLTQAEYDAGSPVSTTFYAIT